MRQFHLMVLLVGLCLGLPGAAAKVDLDFASPATLSGNLAVETTWAIIEMSPGSRAALFSTGSPSVIVHYTNLTWSEFDLGQNHIELPHSVAYSQHEQSLAEFIATWPTGGYLGIRSTNLVVQVENVDGEFSVLQPGGFQIHTSPTNPDWYTPWASTSNVPMMYFETLKSRPGSTLVTGSDGVFFEFLGADIDCQASSCPTGGEIESTVIGPSTSNSVSFERIGPISGPFEYVGSPARMLTGAAQISASIAGKVRFPQAVIGDCACGLEGDQTLALSGELTLVGLRPAENGRVQTSIHGEAFSARIDENSIPILALLGMQTASAVATLAVLAALKLLLPLFTRLSKQQALEHPKRQRIFAYIQEHPGANFREVSRQTDIAAGTVRHHLTVLERAGHIVEHVHQGTIRLFENHGKFDANWVDAVLLREPPLAQLHAWVKQHPAVAQKDVLEAMEVEGWSRSTTQHRLARLVQGGVLTLRLQGRLKMYSVADARARKPGLVSLPHWSTNANASQA